jgi:uncharacterized RDD family membrane protein YckC
MRCPKCQYISFESEERCRNCGYEFAMDAPLENDSELPLRADDDIGPPDDLALRPASELSSSPPAETRAETLGRPVPGSELPLFGGVGPSARGETSPVAARGTVKSPVSSRRPRAEPPRGVPSAGAEGRLQFAAPDGAGVSRHAGSHPLEDPGYTRPLSAPAPGAASIGRRALGTAIDLIVLAAIDVVVIDATLRVVGLPLREADKLPLLPLVGFLCLLNGGYLAGFVAAGGQTMGKMLAGVRVVAEDGRRASLGQAVVRAAAYAVSVLPLGLGCLPALVSAGRRTVHDRLAGTRVVRG